MQSWTLHLDPWRGFQRHARVVLCLVVQIVYRVRRIRPEALCHLRAVRWIAIAQSWEGLQVLQLTAIPGELRLISDGQHFKALIMSRVLQSHVLSACQLAPGDTAHVRCPFCCLCFHIRSSKRRTGSGKKNFTCLCLGHLCHSLGGLSEAGEHRTLQKRLHLPAARMPAVAEPEKFSSAEEGDVEASLRHRARILTSMLEAGKLERVHRSKLAPSHRFQLQFGFSGRSNQNVPTLERNARTGTCTRSLMER